MLTRRKFLVLLPGAAAGAVMLQCSTCTALAQELSADDRLLAAAPGDQQSPINIRTRQVLRGRNAKPLIVNYPTRVDMEVEYISKDQDCDARGPQDTIEATGFSQPAFVRFDGDRWDLEQFHFHRRSEHRVNGQDFPMEQHFVHMREDGKILVVGLFLIRGGNAPQDEVLAELPQECGPNISLSCINLKAMLPRDLTAFRYRGSLTTGDEEPYMEGVRWNVLREQMRIQNDSIQRFRALFPVGNARPTQPVNDRKVRLAPGRFA